MPLSFEQASDLQHEYEPTNQETLDVLGTITLAPVVGPTAAGKNHIMAYLAKTAGYHQAGNITTRELRRNDPANIRHQEQGEFLEAIERGSLVQFAAHMGSRALYGTAIEDYEAGRINVKDIYAHTVEDFIRYGFRHVRPVCVVAPGAEWESRLDERFAEMSPEQRAGRLDEAADSLRWIMEESPSMERVVVIGDDRYSLGNIERIQAFVEQGSPVPTEQVHLDTAEEMLRILPKLRAKFLAKVEV
jgi:guanylate kinase